jgi:hypothetical protein
VQRWQRSGPKNLSSDVGMQASLGAPEPIVATMAAADTGQALPGRAQ